MTSTIRLARTSAAPRGHRVAPGRDRRCRSVAAERTGPYDARAGDQPDQQRQQGRQHAARETGEAGGGRGAGHLDGVDVGGDDVGGNDVGGDDVGGDDVGGDDVGGNDVGGNDVGGNDVAPFGLAILAELPELSSVLGQLRVADRAMLAAVAGLAELLATDHVERTTGVGIDHWLAAVAVQTRMDRRLLMRTCRLLRRLPTLDRAVRDERISFAQLRGLAIALRDAPADLDEGVDRLLAALLDGLRPLERPDPDVLVRQVADGIEELRRDEDLAQRERDAGADRYLALQPSLDGTGGRFHGQLDAAGLALLDAATTPPEALLDHPGGYGAARADTLLARLAGSRPGAAHHTPDSQQAPDSPHAPDSQHVRDGQDASDSLHTPAARPTGGTATGPGWWDRLAAPQLLVRIPFDTLLDGGVPADLLTGLVGGRLRLTSTAARQLLETRGAELRTIVVDDDGTVLGVGRSTRRPPGWLRDVQAAIHDTCTGPGCDRPARGADTDHASPWWPAHPGDPPGRTDVDNVGPLCPTTNRAKEAAGWQVTQTRAGVRTWRHPPSGLTTTTVPSTWRPPGDPRRRRPPDRRGDRPPPRSAPPGPHRPGQGQHADGRPPKPPDEDLRPF